MFTKRVSGEPIGELNRQRQKKQKRSAFGLGSVGGLMRRLGEVTPRTLATKYTFSHSLVKFLNLFTVSNNRIPDLLRPGGTSQSTN